MQRTDAHYRNRSGIAAFTPIPWRFGPELIEVIETYCTKEDSETMRITTSLTLTALLTLGAAARGQVPAEEVAANALAAWTVNETQTKDVLYSKESWSDFTGHSNGMLSGPQEVHYKTPVFHSHWETVDGHPRYVMDGWADQPPLVRIWDLKKRINLGENLLDRGARVREFLGQGRRLTLVDTKTEQGHKAYVVLSKARPAGQGGRGSPTACPSAMDATLYVDSITFFPFRVEATVVQANMCAPDPSNQFNKPGAEVQFHQLRVSGKDSCGETHNIWIVDQAVLMSNLGQVDGVKDSPGTIAERVFMFGPDYRGGKQKTVQVSDNFRLFVACAVMRAEGSTPPPVDDRVATESYFPLEGIPPTKRQIEQERAYDIAGVKVPPAVVMRTTKPPESSPAWFSANFDWSARGIDARGFEATKLGVNGDYSIPAYLKPAVREQGRQNAEEVTGRWESREWILIMKQFLMKRMQETFGDARITAGRMASLELAISVTPMPSTPGVVAFHRDFLFDMAKPLSQWEMKLARVFWLANSRMIPRLGPRQRRRRARGPRRFGMTSAGLCFRGSCSRRLDR